jgi:hypothetical protein
MILVILDLHLGRSTPVASSHEPVPTAREHHPNLVPLAGRVRALRHRTVIVSLTDYRVYSLRSLPGIARAGTRWSLGWYGLPGAVGLFLWADPVHRRTGSVSVDNGDYS